MTLKLKPWPTIRKIKKVKKLNLSNIEVKNLSELMEVRIKI